MNQPHFVVNLPEWVIFDLDGTLANIKHRLPFIKGEKKNWDAFNAGCINDEPKQHIIDLLKTMHHLGRYIAIFSGRDGNYRRETEAWLGKHEIPFHLLSMRNPNDKRSDNIVKKEMFEATFKPHQIWFVVEDRDRVVEVWRELGLTCLQCQKGDY